MCVFIYSNLEQDVKRLEANIKKQIANSADTGANPTEGDTCRICNKVKFAGGAGYTCHYCQLKSCSRCGGRLTLKAKVGDVSTTRIKCTRLGTPYENRIWKSAEICDIMTEWVIFSGFMQHR